MPFWRKKKDEPEVDQELLAKRTASLTSLEADLDVMGWDRVSKYYQVFSYEGEDVIVLKNEIPDKPISFLTGRTMALGIEPGVVGCVLSFEGWTYPDSVDPNTATVAPADHPDRREIRVLAAEYKDGMSISIQRFRDNNEIRVTNKNTPDSRGALISALKFSIGALPEPDDDMRTAATAEMREYLREQLMSAPGFAAILQDQRFSNLYKDISALLNKNASTAQLEACIRSHAKSLEMGEDELIALAKMTGLI